MPYADRSLALRNSVPAGNSLPGRAGMVSFFDYATPDTLATVVAAGYFNNARARLQAGDVVQVAAGIGGTPATDSYVFASVPATGNVTVTIEAGTP
jgi:hypothetical protein